VPANPPRFCDHWVSRPSIGPFFIADGVVDFRNLLPSHALVVEPHVVLLGPSRAVQVFPVDGLELLVDAVLPVVNDVVAIGAPSPGLVSVELLDGTVALVGSGVGARVLDKAGHRVVDNVAVVGGVTEEGIERRLGQTLEGGVRIDLGGSP